FGAPGGAFGVAGRYGVESAIVRPMRPRKVLLMSITPRSSSRAGQSQHETLRHGRGLPSAKAARVGRGPRSQAPGRGKAVDPQLSDIGCLRIEKRGGATFHVQLRPRMSATLGVDVGGTFTDFFLVDEQTGETHTHKVASTPDDPARAILQ